MTPMGKVRVITVYEDFPLDDGGQNELLGW